MMNQEWKQQGIIKTLYKVAHRTPIRGFFIGIIKEWGKAIRQDLISDCQTELPHN